MCGMINTLREMNGVCIMENTAIAAECVCPDEAEKKVLVWVTSPLGCKKIMEEARAYAERVNAELVIVSIQSPITGDWENKVRTLEKLERAARGVEAQLTVDFGRPVTVDELRLTLRADYPHDSFWKSAAVRFSDGTMENLSLQMTARPQRFPISPRTVTSLTLCDLQKNDDPSPFIALTQIEAWGMDASTQKE